MSERDYEEYFNPPDPKPGDHGTCANCGYEIILVAVKYANSTGLVESLEWTHSFKHIGTLRCGNPELGGPA